MTRQSPVNPAGCNIPFVNLEAYPLKEILIAVLLAATASTAAHAETYASHEFDFGELGSAAYGIIESVREVQLDNDPAELVDVFEHAIRPETRDELVVRLDDGRPITVVQDAMRRFEPGQRVLVVPDGHSARVEHA